MTPSTTSDEGPQEAMEELSPTQRMVAFQRQMRVDSSGLDTYFETLSFSPDDFQREALAAFALGSSVLVSAPTGSGKTVVGEGAVYVALQRGERAFYTTPIKALSNQKYREFCAKFGTERVGLLTGDTAINGRADVVVMTTEVLRNMIYADADLDDVGAVVLDEVHYLADLVRGPVWEEVLIQLPQWVKVVCLSATVSNIQEFGSWIAEVRGECEVVVSTRRPVPLYQQMIVRNRLYDLYAAENYQAHEAQTHMGRTPGRLNPFLLDAVQQVEMGRAPRVRGGRAGRSIPARISRPRIAQLLQGKDLLPAIVFIFSRAGCDEAVGQLLEADLVLTTAAEQRQIEEVAQQAMLAIPIADHGVLGLAKWQAALSRGIASHHAGLLPILKETVETLFSAGLLKVVYATETLALGINMPARTVVLESLEKWNGSEHIRLNPGEYTQLTGRAGRRGIDVEGHAVVLQRKVVQPEELAQLSSRAAYPLRSAFFPNYNMVVNLLAHATIPAARQVLESSFAQYQADDAVVGLASRLRREQGKLAELEQQLECSQGDAPEYFALREELSKAQKKAQKLTRAGNREVTAQRVAALRTGETIRYREKKRPLYGVVLGTPNVDWGPPSVKILGENAKVYQVSAADLREPPEVIGHLQLPRSGVRRSRDRAGVVKGLRRLIAGAGRDVSVSRRPERSPEAAKLARTVDRLEKQVRDHPVHSCPHRESHARLGHEWARTRRECDRIAREINSKTSSIAHEFDKVLDVLREFGYVEGGDVTERGEQLRLVFGERDLLVAESLAQGVFSGLDDAEMAALICALVYEPRGDLPTGEPSLPTSRLRQAWWQVEDIYSRIHRAEHQVGLDRTKAPSAELSHITYRWAEGATLSSVLSDSDLPPGDFVRWMRQTIDLLEQLRRVTDPDLKKSVNGAIRNVRRGVVQWTEG